MKKSLVNIEAALVTNGQPAKAVEPGEGALYNPAVPAQLLAAIDPSPRNSRYNPSLAKSFPISFGVVPFVSMQLVRALARSASLPVDWRNSINHLLQHGRVRYVSTCAFQRERNASPTDHKMALRAWFAFIRRVRPDTLLFGLPLFTPLALTVCESKEALDQSVSPSWLRVSSSSLCSFSHTPACSQSRSLRQHVIPEPQPISWGSISHCKPDLSTNTMPVSAARFGIRGLPPLGLGGSGGNSGSITFHNSSDINAFAIPNFTRSNWFC